MPDNEIKREKTFSEELLHFKERMKEVFDNYHNLNGGEDPLYIAVLRDSHRAVRKAEEEITRQQAEIERLQNTINDILDCQPILVERAEKYAKSDAIKEFAERLKEKIDVVYSIKHLKDNIDNAVKEMVGNIE